MQGGKSDSANEDTKDKKIKTTESGNIFRFSSEIGPSAKG